MESFKKWRRKFRSVRDLRRADRLLVLEAMLALGLARLLVRILPFRVMAPWLSRAPDDGTCDDLLVARVRRAVTTSARNVPWSAVCLPQAMAAKVLLARRGCGSAFCLGAATDADGKLVSHAWLVTGGRIVVGAAGARGVAPLARLG